MEFENGSTKTTISYAQTLRRMGYRTAIHALPKEGQDLVNSLLDRGYSNTTIAKQINGEYKQHLKDKELRLISNYSIRTYKNNYWMNSPEFSKIISTGNPTIKKKLAEVEDRANQLLTQFNALEQMIALVLKEKALVIDRDSPFELNNPMGMIDPTRDAARWRLFCMCKKIFKIQLELGLIKISHSPPVCETTTAVKDEEINDENLMKKLTNLYNELNNQQSSQT